MARVARPHVETVLVAGGAGFLGSYVCDRLIDAGNRVICLDNFHTGSRDNLVRLERQSRFSVLEADVTTPLPPSLKVDRIYNLACPASPRHYQDDPVHTMLTNVLGMHHLLDLARRTGARVLQSSTSEIYGDPEVHPQSESYLGHVNATGPRACYDEGKRAAETLCFDYLRRHAVDVRVARIFNTYGPRMRPDDGRIVSNLITQALSGLPLTIYGSGEQTRSFCFVTDLVEGLLRLMALPENPQCPVNLGNPEEYTIRGLAALVAELTGSEPEVMFEPLPVDDPHCRRPDITRARALLGWAPTMPVRQGLMTTIAWFAEQGRHGARPRSQPSLAAVAGPAAD
jgi:UDP-glucuronate decarboxylase